MSVDEECGGIGVKRVSGDEDICMVGLFNADPLLMTCVRGLIKTTSEWERDQCVLSAMSDEQGKRSVRHALDRIRQREVKAVDPPRAELNRSREERA